MTNRIAAALLLFTCAGASAHGGGNWLPAVTGLCLAQDPAYARLPTGALLMQDEAMPRFLASLPADYLACLQKHKAVSANLCKALLSPEPNPGLSNDEYEQIAAKYEKELNAIQAISCQKKSK